MPHIERDARAYGTDGRPRCSEPLAQLLLGGRQPTTGQSSLDQRPAAQVQPRRTVEPGREGAAKQRPGQAGASGSPVFATPEPRTALLVCPLTCQCPMRLSPRAHPYRVGPNSVGTVERWEIGLDGAIDTAETVPQAKPVTRLGSVGSPDSHGDHCHRGVCRALCVMRQRQPGRLVGC